MHFYDMNGEQREAIIKQIAWTLCNGDDYCIHVSNVARDILDEYGIDEGDLYLALCRIADVVGDMER